MQGYLPRGRSKRIGVSGSKRGSLLIKSRNQVPQPTEAEMLTGLHFGLDFTAEFGKRDPRPMGLVGRW